MVEIAGIVIIFGGIMFIDYRLNKIKLLLEDIKKLLQK